MKPKNKIKLFGKAIELVKLLIQFENRKSINLDKSIPKYSSPNTGNYPKGGIIHGDKKESIILPNGKEVQIPNFSKEWNALVNHHLKEKGLHNTEPFAMPPIETKLPMFDYDALFDKTKFPVTPPLGSTHDFHKQAVEAEKELDKVCKPKKECPHENVNVQSYYFAMDAKSITESICIDCGLNLTLERHQRLKNRQLEIGKEIEKLRIEARTIKNQLKD